MYEIIYSIKAENRIKFFINSYKNIFLDSYTDTWLFYEDLIRKNFINNSEKFYNEIIDSIENIISNQKLLWYKILKNNNFQIKIDVWNFRLFIEFSENIENKIRFIKDIEINKK